jgi:S-formylglutathione hydrolase FrmB
MKNILLFILLLVSFFSHSQSVKKGTVVSVHFVAPSLKGNIAGENPMRSMTIYLPPGYAGGATHYPVIYYLHGYSFNDSTCFAWLQVNILMDAAITRGIIRPTIVVVPDSYTSFGGSFYTNSTATGNWGDYIGRDVVQYVDRHFRTIPNRNSRGVTGISMGGNWAIKMGMLFPEVFGAVYASTPAVLNWSDAINPSIPAFKLISERKDQEINASFPAQLMIDLARTYSPDTNKAPGSPIFQLPITAIAWSSMQP